MAYGMITGFLVEHTKLNRYLCIAIALIIGRAVFMFSVFLSYDGTNNFQQFFTTALTPGITAAIGQITLLPFVGKWWISFEKKND